MGPFEEEEEGIGTASDVVKVPVQGEDPRLSKGGQSDVGTSVISGGGCVSLGLLTTKRRDHYITIPQYRFNKTNQHNRRY